MVLYIEIVLIVNVLIHILTIFMIKECFYLPLKKTFILTILIDLIYMVLYVYNFRFILIPYLIPLIFVIFSFKTNISFYFKTTIVYYLISFLLYGLSINFKISSNFNYFFIFIIYFILVGIMYILFKRKSINIYYKIEYQFLNKKYNLNAFFDTGCNLLHRGLPVVVINKKYSFNIYTDELFQVATATNISYEPIYLINNLKIGKNKYKCYCVFLDITYEAIIGVNLVSILHI